MTNHPSRPNKSGCSITKIIGDEQHVNEYIEKRMEDPYYRDVLQGMYMAIDVINNDLMGEFGTDEVSKALGFFQLAKKLERNM